MKKLKMKLQLLLIRGVMFAQLHMPYLLPIIDRVLHAFGICIGH